ncbi:unnamed protein product [Ceratitis capitata]|uniref:(Mediterranean fruit fly) hypothetical protein n=1 Tax=Ceratitis capitata TaxID=7213 RepID=A0A811V1P6_CERCA|nr:unnamed protein product [Ceratitis capitata]
MSKYIGSNVFNISWGFCDAAPCCTACYRFALTNLAHELVILNCHGDLFLRSHEEQSTKGAVNRRSTAAVSNKQPHKQSERKQIVTEGKKC